MTITQMTSKEDPTVQTFSIEIPITLTEDATLPQYATHGASGMDIYTPFSLKLEPFERKLVWTGLRIAVPEGYEAQIRPRSGLALKKGLTLLNSPGTIDCDYRGEIGLIMINLSQEKVTLEKGERIAQMVICPVIKANLQSVKELDDTHRGEGGFGSTGKH